MKYLLCLLLLVLFPLSALAIDYLGTEATFGWTQPDGSQPEGYVVWVSRNGAEATDEQTVIAKEATISGSAGDTIIVSVQAFLGELVSEMSVASDPVTFRVLEAPQAVQVRCQEGKTFQEVGGGWWSCR